MIREATDSGIKAVEIERWLRPEGIIQTIQADKKINRGGLTIHMFTGCKMAIKTKMASSPHGRRKVVNF